MIFKLVNQIISCSTVKNIIQNQYIQHYLLYKIYLIHRILTVLKLLFHIRCDIFTIYHYMVSWSSSWVNCRQNIVCRKLSHSLTLLRASSFTNAHFNLAFFHCVYLEQIYQVWEGYLRKIPGEVNLDSRLVFFRKYSSQYDISV